MDEELVAALSKLEEEVAEVVKEASTFDKYRQVGSGGLGEQAVHTRGLGRAGCTLLGHIPTAISTLTAPLITLLPYHTKCRYGVPSTTQAHPLPLPTPAA
jgi:hypothetical protein